MRESPVLVHEERDRGRDDNPDAVGPVQLVAKERGVVEDAIGQVKRGRRVHQQRRHCSGHRETEKPDYEEWRVLRPHPFEMLEILLREREPFVEEEIPQVRDEETHGDKHVVETNVEVCERQRKNDFVYACGAPNVHDRRLDEKQRHRVYDETRSTDHRVQAELDVAGKLVLRTHEIGAEVEGAIAVDINFRV